jgi:diguanylate cyclase (GGDEF)-like protein/putative nucleotidyltransferase with HDIG domain
MAVAKVDNTAASDAGYPGVDDATGTIQGRRNGSNGGPESQRQQPPASPREAHDNGQSLREFELHSTYLRALFGQVLTAGIIGLLLGLAAATIFLQKVFPNLAAYPAQAGLFIAFVALGWILLRRAQSNTVRLWRKTWEDFEMRLADANAMANRDSLTQLHNRRSFYETLQDELDNAQSSRTSLAVLILDIDDLKVLNDEYGHQVGDTALAHLADALNSLARPQDVTARLGGDEFSMIMPQTDHRRAEEIATQLWQLLEERPLALPDGTIITVGASIGIGGYPWGGDSMESVIHRADASLYANKLARKGSSGEIQALERRNVATAVVEVLSLALDIRDKLTHRHCHRVSQMAAAVARHMGLDDNEVRTIEHAAALHDIGKIGVPDSILLKRGSLDEREWTDMRRHSELGYYILKGISIFKDAADIVYSHHERYDGKGYPRGLKGEEIPLGSRVFTVVDSYDAMISRRPYRKGSKPRGEALEELRRHAGSQFDPEVVEAFLRVVPTLQPDDVAI